jgi:hypothetical protein
MVLIISIIGNLANIPSSAIFILALLFLVVVAFPILLYHLRAELFLPPVLWVISRCFYLDKIEQLFYNIRKHGKADGIPAFLFYPS